MISARFTPRGKAKRKNQETPLCRCFSLSGNALHWWPFKAACVKTRPSWRSWATFTLSPSSMGLPKSTTDPTWNSGNTPESEPKTNIWNESGRAPRPCEEMRKRVELFDTDARNWKGSEVPTHERGIKVLGCPLSHEDFVRPQLEAKKQETPNAVGNHPTCSGCAVRFVASPSTQIQPVLFRVLLRRRLSCSCP